MGDNMFADWDLDAYERCLGPWWVSGGLVGWSHDRRPVYYEPFGKCKWTQIIARIPKRQLIKIDLVHQMRVLGAMEEAAYEKGESMKQGIAIADLEGFGMDQCMCHAAKMLAELMVVRDRLIPNMLHQVLVINAPASFSYGWRIFKFVFLRGLPIGEEDHLKFALGGPIPQQAITRFLNMVKNGGHRGSANSPSPQRQRPGSCWRCWLCQL